MRCNYRMECSASPRLGRFWLCFIMVGLGCDTTTQGPQKIRGLLFYELLPAHQQTAIKVRADLAPTGAADS